MSDIELLLLTIIFIPLINCLAIKFSFSSPKILNFLITSTPILFLTNLIGLYSNIKENSKAALYFIRTSDSLSISFIANLNSLYFLFLLGFIWIIFSFYFRRFLQLGKKGANMQSLAQLHDFQMFFSLLISLINFIILAKNLITLLFFYNCLILWYYFFTLKFLYKKQERAINKKMAIKLFIKKHLSNFLTFLLYFQSILLFLAVIMTYKFSGNIEFSSNFAILNLANQPSATLLLLYLGAIFLSPLLGNYFLYKNLNFNPIAIFTIFALGFGMVGMVIFYKLLTELFSSLKFSEIITYIGNNYFYYICSLHLLLTAVAAIFSKNFKASFFYFFFNQLIAALLTIFIFAINEESKIFLSMVNFLLTQLLIFLTFSNIIIFLKQARNKEITGLFYKLKITIILMIFGLLSAIGIAPTIGAVEKFWLIKILLDQKLSYLQIIIGINQLLLVIFTLRLLLFMLSSAKNQEAKEEKEDIALGKNIDFDSYLILSPLLVAFGLFILMFFDLLLRLK
jgi:formate hydrogenlyase subunit 3/multisubunit Na+/H+ antiporter MnhD subunit